MIETKNTMDGYKEYKKVTENPVTLPVFRLILNEYAKFIIRKVFDGLEVQLSREFSLGSLAITGKKKNPVIDPETGHVRGVNPDWGATKKLWATRPDLKEQKYLVHYTNEHTGGIGYKFSWDTNQSLLTNKSIYSFVPSRKNKRTLPIMIKNGKEYIVSQ